MKDSLGKTVANGLKEFADDLQQAKSDSTVCSGSRTDQDELEARREMQRLIAEIVGGETSISVAVAYIKHWKQSHDEIERRLQGAKAVVDELQKGANPARK